MDREKKTKIRELVEELRVEAPAEIEPVYPFNLVYIVGQSGRHGRIITPEKHNKVLYEALVIQSHRPKMVATKTGGSKVAESPVVPGQHVLFQHYKGAPVPMDNFGGDFRLIADEDFVGILEYAPEEQASVLDKLMMCLPQVALEDIEELIKRFVFVDRETRQTTLSGK